MAIPGELAPDLLDPSDLNTIISSPYDTAYAQQLINMRLPVRPALGVDRRQRADALQGLLSQNELANAMRYELGLSQAENDANKIDADLAGTVASALAETNESGMAQLRPIQGLTSDGGAGLNEILGSGDLVNRSKVLADAAKAQAEAESEPIKAQAALESAQNQGGDDWETEFAPDGSIIGFKNKNASGPAIGPVNRSQGAFSPQTSGGGEMTGPTGDRLIMNSDGSGTLIRKDGSKQTFSKEQINAVRSKYGR